MSFRRKSFRKIVLKKKKIISTDGVKFGSDVRYASMHARQKIGGVEFCPKYLFDHGYNIATNYLSFLHFVSLAATDLRSKEEAFPSK